MVWPAFIVKQGKNRETPANAEIIRNADGLETPNAVECFQAAKHLTSTTRSALPTVRGLVAKLREPQFQCGFAAQVGWYT